ncbi:uncharacterized protein [Clytia hemisphaerica]
MADFNTPRKRKHKDLTDLVGFVSYVSPPKSKYFEVFILVQEKMEKRLVVYDVNQHGSFLKTVDKGVTITHVSGATNGDFFFTDQSNIVYMSPPFEHYEIPIQISTIKEAMTEVHMFSRLHLEVLITSTNIPGISKEMLPYQQLLVTDNSLPHPKPLTVYSDMVGKFEVNNSYRLTHITVSKFNRNRILKGSDRSEQSELLEGAIKLLAVPTTMKVGRISSVELSSLKDINLCKHCKNPVIYIRSIVTCETCDQGMAQSDVLTTSIVKFTLKITSRCMPLCCDRKLIEKLLQNDGSDIELILCEMLNRNVQVNIKETSNEVLSMKRIPEFNDAAVNNDSELSNDEH